MRGGLWKYRYMPVGISDNISQPVVQSSWGSIDSRMWTVDADPFLG